jgi:hypothetical protein
MGLTPRSTVFWLRQEDRDKIKGLEGDIRALRSQ